MEADDEDENEWRDKGMPTMDSVDEGVRRTPSGSEDAPEAPPVNG